MPINKNALLRYRTLDRCLRNKGRRYYFNDLLEEINDALLEENPSSAGIQIRQLREDIRFMKSEGGYAAPIVAVKDGRKAYYCYEDPGFSINNSPLTSTEAEQLKSAIEVLQRFEGKPEFDWVHELTPKLKDKFGLKDQSQSVIGFETNLDYSGHEFITPFYNAIVNKRVLKVHYTPFGKEQMEITFHPHYLKQYNNRWFVFGMNEEMKIATWNMALDRVDRMNEVDTNNVGSSIDWEDHFYDIIGVTRPEGEPQEVVLQFTKEQAPYIQTKPLHPSQKSNLLEDGKLEVRLKLIPNFEFEALLLSYGNSLTVKHPEGLKMKIESKK